MTDTPPKDISTLTAWGAIAGTVVAGVVAIVQSICHTIERIIMRKK